MTPLLVFILILLAAVFVYWRFVARGHRKVYLLILSLLFTSYFSVVFTVYFLANVLIVFHISGKMRADKGKRMFLLIPVVSWLIGNLCLFKYSGIFMDIIERFSGKGLHAGGAAGLLLPLGFSYVIFRLVHFAVESYRDNVPDNDFVDLALYTLFFPSFLAGPVDRFQRFRPQLEGKDRPDTDEINEGLRRILIGIVRKFVIADTLARYVMPVLFAPNAYSRWMVLLAIYGQAIRIYMDFAGYTDMALGVSRLFGIKLMENFNRPYFRLNIAEYWRNWHISVYSWIRDYFFLPFFARSVSKVRVYAGVFITMIVFNLWHRGSLSFLLLGVYHGAGLVLWQMFRVYKDKHPAIARITDRKVLDPVAMFLTFSFVSFGFLLFTLDTGGTMEVLRSICVAR